MNIIVWDSGVTQPKDKGILLKDIIENGDRCDSRNKGGKNLVKTDINKSHSLMAREYKGIKNFQESAVVVTGGEFRGRNPKNTSDRTPGAPTEQRLEINETGKSNALTSVSKDSIVCYGENYIQYDTSGKGYNSQQDRIYFKEKKSNTLSKSHSSITNLKEHETETEILWRKLTPIECERLQTVPDNYTNHVSNSQRYKMLGNGWTVDVITHILKYMEK